MGVASVIPAFVVYRWTNAVNGKAYVGYTNKERRRRYEHRGGGSSNRLLRAAMKKYGKDKFLYEVLWGGQTLKEAHEREEHFIAALGTLAPGGYNLAAGGGGSKGYRHSPEQRAAKTARNHERWAVPGYREQISEKAKAFWAKPEHALVLRERMRRRWADPAYVEEMRQRATGRKHSAETRKKLSSIAFEKSRAREVDRGQLCLFG